MLYVFLYHQLHLFTAETSGSNILFVSSKQLKVVGTYTGALQWVKIEESYIYRLVHIQVTSDSPLICHCASTVLTKACGSCEMQCLTVDLCNGTHRVGHALNH